MVKSIAILDILQVKFLGIREVVAKKWNMYQFVETKISSNKYLTVIIVHLNVVNREGG